MVEMGGSIVNGWKLTAIINYVVWDNNVMALLIVTRDDIVGRLVINLITVGDQTARKQECYVRLWWQARCRSPRTWRRAPRVVAGGQW